MAEEKVERIKVVTPVGIASFPWLTTPSTKFNPDGQYQTKLICPADDPVVKKFMADMDKLVEATYNKAHAALKTKKQKDEHKKGFPYMLEETDDGELTGNVIISARQNASFISKKGKNAGEKVDTFLNFFDAAMQPIDNPKPIFSGSKLRLSCEANLYENKKGTSGVALRLKAVQIIDLCTGGGRTAEEYGFTEEEGYKTAVLESEEAF
jgi:hypothetical protein